MIKEPTANASEMNASRLDVTKSTQFLSSQHVGQPDHEQVHPISEIDDEVNETEECVQRNTHDSKDDEWNDSVGRDVYRVSRFQKTSGVTYRGIRQIASQC